MALFGVAWLVILGLSGAGKAAVGDDVILSACKLWRPTRRILGGLVDGTYEVAPGAAEGQHGADA